MWLMVKPAKVIWKTVYMGNSCAELQKGVSQQDLVITKIVLFKKSATVVFALHSSAFAQPSVFISRESAEETR